MSWVITPQEQTPVDRVGIQNVTLLLHGDGANGSTTIVDSSPSPKNVTPVGNAQISTAQSKFGGASLAFDGNGDYLSVPSSTDITLGGSDFTFELWAYLNSNTAGELLFWNANAGAFGLRLSASGGNLLLLASITGTSHAINTPVATIDNSSWTHLAISRFGNTIAFYKNGTQTYQNTNFTGSMAAGTLNVIGGRTVSPTYMNGYIDDLRITKGVARYTSNFTPPTAPFPDI